MKKLDEKLYLEQRIEETQVKFARNTKISFKRVKEHKLDRLSAELQLTCYTDLVELKTLLEIYETIYGKSFKDLRKRVEKGTDKLRMNIDENWGNSLEKYFYNNLN